MREMISPEELLSQLEEIVALLVASPAEQTAWLDETGFPADEIALQYDDAVGAFLGRLREHDLIDDADEASLRELRTYVDSVFASLFVDSDLTAAPEWQRVRSLAQATLASLRRPVAQKAPPGT